MKNTLYLLLSLLLLLSCGKRSNILPSDLVKIEALIEEDPEEQLSESLLRIANLRLRYLSAFLIGGILLLLVLFARIVRNNARIHSLEKLLKENFKDNELIRLQKEALEVENRNLQSLQNSEVGLFKISEVYLRFHNKQEWKVKPEDWKELFQATDSAYLRFSHHLNERLLKPTIQELQICYLIKTNVPPGLIAQLLNCSATNISMIRNRLYEKTHGKKGSSTQFDQFIDKI